MSSNNHDDNESIWLSPEVSQALLNEYQKFLDNEQQQLRQQLGQKTGEGNLEKLLEEFKEKNETWSEKLTLCDPETFETFMNAREGKEKEESWKTLSPEVKEAIMEIERITERVKRHAEKEAWKDELIENSRRQIELLEKVDKQSETKYWDQPLSRREFYNFNLERKRDFVQWTSVLGGLLAIVFAGLVIWGLLTGNWETLGRDIGVGVIAILIMVASYKDYEQICSQQRKINEEKEES